MEKYDKATKKPTKAHPWKQQRINGEIDRWNREQSNMRNVNTITSARPTTLARHGESEFKKHQSNVKR